jgi:hypothetical protein
VSDLKFEAAGVVGMGMVTALFATTRSTRFGEEHYLQHRRNRTPVIFVFWHGQLLPLVHYHRNEGVVVLVSEHADGEYVTQVIERHGFGTVRGSSTRGGTKGLKGLIRAARAGRDLALTPDGPRGPAGDFKPGALAVAQTTGLPVVPVAAGASGGWRFKSWDGFLVPKPFARIVIGYGEPVLVPRGATRDDLEGLARQLGHRLDALTNEAAAAAGA